MFAFSYYILCSVFFCAASVAMTYAILEHKRYMNLTLILIGLHFAFEFMFVWNVHVHKFPRVFLLNQIYGQNMWYGRVINELRKIPQFLEILCNKFCECISSSFVSPNCDQWRHVVFGSEFRIFIQIIFNDYIFEEESFEKVKMFNHSSSLLNR